MSVFSDIKPRNHASRNAFDLSRRTVFSAKAGMIVPMFVQSVIPDSTIKIDVKQLMRTQPIQTAAFSGASINYDFVFCPLNHLYSSFNQFIAQRENKNLVYQPSNRSIPTFNLKNFVENTLTWACYDYANAMLFGSRESLIASWKKLFPSRTDIPPYISAPLAHDSSQSIFIGVIRNLDMFGYGNFLPLLKELYLVFMDDQGFVDESDWLAYLSSHSWTSSSVSFNSIDSVRSDFAVSFLSKVGQPFTNFLPSSGINPNLWPVLAYNKAFYEYYRSSYYDLDYKMLGISEWLGNTNASFQYVNLFNYDDWQDDDNNYPRLLAMFAPKNHLYKRDLFTGVLPSTQFGDVEVMSDNRQWMKLFVSNNGSSPSAIYGQANGQNVLTNTAGSGTVRGDFRFDPALAISVLETRRADAMQRFKERMMRAGDKTKDVFKAHGWSEPRSEGVFEPVFLGSFDGRLDLNVVAATTSSGEGQELAQLASNGTAVVSGSEINFKSEDFGIIIGLCYVLKDAEYDAYGVERHLQLTEPFDYPYPELQNISLGPVVKGELTAWSEGGQAEENQFNYVLGYLPKYMEYKTAVDKVHGEFYSANPFIDPDDPEKVLNAVNTGIFSDWVTPRQRLTDIHSLNYLYQSSDIFDNIFYRRSSSLIETDQFLFNCYVKCTAVEPLSVIGLPI